VPVGIARTAWLPIEDGRR